MLEGDFINIREELIKLKDDKYCKFNKKLCPDTKKDMLGIKIPVLREFSKRLLKEEGFENSYNNIKEDYFEEIIVKGFLIAYSKISLEEKLYYIKEHISKMDSWAMTDTFVPALKIKEKELQVLWEFILPYINSDKEFEVRFSIICMLDYYLKDSYVDKVINILDNVKHEGYYVKMAIAWTLAEIGIKYNDKLICYLKGKNNLDKFTYNKAIQKMIESFRIDSKQKEELKKMKRK